MTSPTLLHRCRLALLHTLWVLLALGPFLHAHYGSSSRTGFHLDEVSQAVSHLPHLGHSTELSQADTPESPALGVATSLAQSEEDGLPLFALAWLLAPLLPRLAQLSRHWPRVPLGSPVRPRYRAGWPPPCLAPPLH